MAVKFFSTSHPLSSCSSISIFNKTREFSLSYHTQQQFPAISKPNRAVKIAVSASLQEIEIASDLANHFHENPSSLFLIAEGVGYSVASYYTSLGLFVISVPGLWSLIKRSVKSKIVKKTYVQADENKKAPNQVAGEIFSYFTRNNFAVTDRGETITQVASIFVDYTFPHFQHCLIICAPLFGFEGMMVPSRGQAALLTFCTCISLASVALVLTITFPDVGNNWFLITALSPLAGIYYWQHAARKEQIKIKMVVGENGTLSDVIVQGDDQQVEQMRKELQLNEKGMVYVKGILER